MKENEVLMKLITLNKEWSDYNDRVIQIKEELKPIIIERLKQLNYTEEEVEVKTKTAPRKYEKKKILRGYVIWDEDFKDEDTGDTITIKRHKIVMEDGEWRTGAFSLEELIAWDN